MASTKKTSKSTVILDGKQAEKELKILSDQALQLQKDMLAAKKAGDDISYQKALKEFKKVEKAQDDIKKGAFDVTKVLNNLNKATPNELRKAYNKLNKEVKDLDRTTTEYKNKAKDINKISKELDKVRAETRGVNKASGGVISGFKQFLPALGPAAIVAAIIGIGTKIAGLTKQINDQRRFLSQLTGETGEGLDMIASKVGAISTTFEKDFKETGVAANAFAKQMGIDVDEALGHMQKGFAAGADTSGEFLDMLREYGPQLKEAGYSAEQAIAIMTQQVKDGVFSDKGVDTIKEATLRIREMTPATATAMDNIGLSSTAIQKGLRDGTMSITDVISQVSTKLGELPPQSTEVGTAIADIFGGPGEDAGLEYIKTLGDISGNLDQLVEDSGEFAKQQLKLVKVNEEIERSKNEVFGQADTWFGEVKLGWKRFVLVFWEGVSQLKGTFSDVRQSFKEVFSSFRELLQSMGLFKNESKGMSTGIKIVSTALKVALLPIRAMINGVTLLIDGFKALVDVGKQTFAWVKSGFDKELKPKFNLEDIKKDLANFKDIAVDTFTSSEQETTEVVKQENEKKLEADKEFHQKRKEQSVQAKKEELKAFQEETEKAFQEELILLKERRNQKLISQQEFNEESKLLELAELEARKALLEAYGEETNVIYEQILDKRNEIAEGYLKDFESLTETYATQIADEELAAIDKEIKAYEKAEKTKKKYKDDEKKRQGETIDLMLQVSSEVEQILDASMENGKLSFKEFSKTILLAALDHAQKMLLLHIATITSSQLASKGFIGLVTGAALAAIATGAFVLVKNKIANGFADGGDTGPGGKYEPAGIVHKGEYVVAQEEYAQPEIRSYIQNVVEPARVQRLSVMPGYANGGDVGTNSQQPTTPNQQQTPDNQQFQIMQELHALLLDLKTNGIPAFMLYSDWEEKHNTMQTIKGKASK